MTNWDRFPSSLRWLSLTTGETACLCHPAQIKGAKEGKLESDVWMRKTMPAKSKLCRNQWRHHHRRLCPVVCTKQWFCSESQGQENGRLTFSKHDYTSHNFPVGFLHRVNRDTQIFLLRPKESCLQGLQVAGREARMSFDWSCNWRHTSPFCCNWDQRNSKALQGQC